MEICVRDSICSSWSHLLAIFFWQVQNLNSGMKTLSFLHLFFFWLPLVAVGWLCFLLHLNVLLRFSVSDWAKWDMALVSSCSSARGLYPALAVPGGVRNLFMFFLRKERKLGAAVPHTAWVFS